MTCMIGYLFFSGKIIDEYSRLAYYLSYMQFDDNCEDRRPDPRALIWNVVGTRSWTSRRHLLRLHRRHGILRGNYWTLPVADIYFEFSKRGRLGSHCEDKQSFPRHSEQVPSTGVWHQRTTPPFHTWPRLLSSNAVLNWSHNIRFFCTPVLHPPRLARHWPRHIRRVAFQK